MPPFQVILYQAGAAQIDVPAEKFDINCFATAEDLLQAVSLQVGIPVETLRLATDQGSSIGCYPAASSIITNMDERIGFNNRYWVIFEKNALMEKNLEASGTKLFIEDMTKLLDDPETADFTLKCGSKSFKVHKAILGARSKVFRTMFLSGMKEAVDGEAVIPDIDEKTQEETLHYLYTGKLSGKEFSVKSLCYSADKYELETLMDIICEKIKAIKLEPGDIFISSEMLGKEKMSKL